MNGAFYPLDPTGFRGCFIGPVDGFVPELCGALLFDGLAFVFPVLAGVG